MAQVVLDGQRITDWESFHAVCREAFGFPGFYGANMDAWIDCLTYLYEGDGLSRFVLRPNEQLHIHVIGSATLRRRHPEILEELVACTGFVNDRYRAVGQPPALDLELL